MAEAIVAGVIVMDSRILLCHRSPGRRWYPDVWDLPGGHVEVGESSADALKRELLEELGNAARSLSEHPLERLCTAEFEMDIYAVTAWNGAPANLVPEEHDAIQWFAEEVAELGNGPRLLSEFPRLGAESAIAGAASVAWASVRECHPKWLVCGVSRGAVAGDVAPRATEMVVVLRRRPGAPPEARALASY